LTPWADRAASVEIQDGAMNVVLTGSELKAGATVASRIPDRLFVLELANNHMGDIDHGLRIINECAAVAKDFDFNFAFKLQYRELDTFIHPNFQGRMDVKYIKRFSETRLSRDQTRRLVEAIKMNCFTAICTPFDEPSVDTIIEDNFDILKIASCSFTDWPLLEKIGATNLPVIGSTAGIELNNIDAVVAFMQHRRKDFALMHCVAEYPTPRRLLQLNQIDFLRKRYPNVRIGYSTHEDPSETVPVAISIGKGASIFEKHVGIPTEKYPLNKYSATPTQVRAWLDSARQAYEISGTVDERIEPTKLELESLISLRRGVFANRDIAVGERVKSADVFFAIPTQEGHVTANDWSKYSYYYATASIKKGEALLASNTRSENVRDRIYEAVQKVKAQLDDARIVVPGEAELEISHHYGLDKFNEFGITMITVVNREYCKKLIVVLPGQKHPEQHHSKKEETFHVLHGELRLILDGKERVCRPGTVVTIERGIRHAFESSSGAVFEEISSTHYVDDSFYTDPIIAQNQDRKTCLTYWLA
jgi:sialic acid synthase SpsE/quercetin dioxygenase-like cupin family protein